MEFGERTVSDGVAEGRFTCGDVPGVLWRPVGAAPVERPLVLLAHGGGQHKLGAGLVARARRFVAAGFAAVALDAPGHGERPRTAADQRFAGEVGELLLAGRPVSAWVVRHSAGLAERAASEWAAVLDAAAQEGEGLGPVGYWGLSLASGAGITLAAAEPRLTAAVFGLTGGASLTEAAGRVTVPVEFLVQWDDAFVPRATALDLYGAFASPVKTLHANPGGHDDVPDAQLAACEAVLTRRLIR
ncbi:alpha/beta hydrolase [Streptomyces sp. NRRL WC-3742]|uniref:alpha/beta hydrolase n=1 Tax=Streptomyces sp. NRRL WC-3742 TaxID=1463934 RepID=UPI0004C53721|nr:alpha/beta hydrolase [Streptomyces sp. NRRL WC-3742]